MQRPTVLLSVLAALSLAGGAAHADGANRALVITASNGAANALLVHNVDGTLLNSVSTQGQGGVGGNAGGIALGERYLAVVNFGSSTVSVFAVDRDDRALSLDELVGTVGAPVSVAFGHDHLYVLTTTHVESHAITRHGISAIPDGLAGLVLADGSAAQVGVLNNEVIISEKNNIIETVRLKNSGALTGTASTVADLPANTNAPFGLATRGDSAYVTIAHANEISLVRHDTVLTITGSGTEMAPCWVTLDGPFLFSANSPSRSVSRYLVHGQAITQEVAEAARFNGSPTDITYAGGLLAVIDGAGTQSHLSVFNVDDDGNLTLRGTATMAGGANGVAILR